MSGFLIGPCGVAPATSAFTATSTQSSNFLARTTGLTDARKTIYDTMITGLVNDLGGNTGISTWPILDGLYILSAPDAATAVLNLVSSSFGLSATGSPTFTADHGYTGNGSSTFLDTGFVPSTAGGNYSLNTAAVGVYTQTNRTTNDAFYSLGSVGTLSTDFCALVPHFTDGKSYAQIQNSTVGFTLASAKGLLIGSRTASNLTTQYKFDGTNNGNVGTDATAPVNLANTSIYILARNNNGTADSFTTDQISAAFIGGALDSTQAAAMSARINALMTSLSINVY